LYGKINILPGWRDRCNEFMLFFPFGGIGAMSLCYSSPVEDSIVEKITIFPLERIVISAQESNHPRRLIAIPER